MALRSQQPKNLIEQYGYETDAWLPAGSQNALRAAQTIESLEGLKGKEAETALLKKQAQLYGKPQYQTSTSAPSTTAQTTKLSGPAPTMGNLATVNMPDRPETLTMDLPQKYETPEYVGATMGESPEFVAPERDDARIAQLTQQKAAPGVRMLREAYGVVRSAARGDSPTGRKTLKDTLRNYGTGLEQVMSGAQSAAESQYNTEYQVAYDATTKNWQTQVQKVRDQYAGDVRATENNWQAAVQSVRDEYNSGVIKSQAEYQGKLDAVNRVWGAEVQVETQRVAAENQKVMTVFDAAMDKYLASATRTTKTTGGATTTTSGYVGYN